MTKMRQGPKTEVELNLSPDRLLLCRGCDKKVAAKDFGVTKSGFRRHRCSNCHTTYDLKKCQRCKERRDKATYFSRSAGGQLRDTCNLCLKARPTSAVCKKCQQDLPLSKYGYTALGQRNPRCEDCKRVRPAERWCKGCQKLLPADDFPRFRTKAGNLFLGKRCAPCGDYRKAHRGDKLVYTPFPCLQCGKRYKLALSQYRRENRKYCSPECVHAASCVEHECLGCLKKKPHDAFRRKRSGTGRVGTCIECEDRRKKNLPLRDVERTSSKAMLGLLKRHAAERGMKCTLSPQWAADRIGESCELCGAEMQALVFKRPTDAPVADNVVSVCTPCRRMLAVKGFDELVQWAVAVAQGQQASVSLPAPKKLGRPKKGGWGRLRADASKYERQLRQYGGIGKDGAPVKHNSYENTLAKELEGMTFEQKCDFMQKRRAIQIEGRPGFREDDD